MGNEENKDASNTVDEDDEIPEPKASRGDKKTRKLVAKLGLTPIEPVRRVVMKQGERLIAFDSPDVYKLGNTFVVFGDAKVEDLNSAKRQAQMASQFKAPTPQPPQGETETSTDNQKEKRHKKEREEEKPKKRRKKHTKDQHKRKDTGPKKKKEKKQQEKEDKKNKED